MGSHRAPSGHRAPTPVPVARAHHGERPSAGLPRAVLLETAGWVVFAAVLALVVILAAR
ncbi:MAG: hypothetical protein ACT4PP_07860 [Sporichthyaceae bacterium]